MSLAVAEPVLEPVREQSRTAERPTPSSPARERTRPRRTGPGVGPAARPRRLRFVARPTTVARACASTPAFAPTVVVAPARPRTWRLTDRGVAVVLVVAAALVAASVVVVGLTALRVTGESYRAAHTASISAVAER